MSFNFTVKEFILGNGTGTPTFQFYRRGFNLGSSGSTPEWKDIILSGNTALTLVNAKANGLNYLKLFGGTELLPEQYLDTVTLSGGCEQRNLPSEYTQLEFLQSDGACYIDLLRVPNNDDIIEQKFQKLGDSATTCSWYGSMPSSQQITPRIGIGTFNSQGAKLFAGANYTGMVADADTNIHTLRFQATGRQELTYTLDGVTDVIDASTAVTPPDMFEPAIELTSYLFARHGTNGVQVYDNEGTKIYYHREYLANGTLALNVVPAKRNSDNVLGMYDLVSGQFLTNQGSGNLTAGSTAVPTPDYPMDVISNNGVVKARHQSGLPLGYTLLDYATFDGTQEIDTGLYIHLNDEIRSKFNGATTSFVYGASTSNPRITCYLAAGGNQRWGNITVDNTGMVVNTLYTVVQNKTAFTLNGVSKNYPEGTEFTTNDTLTIGNCNGNTSTPKFSGNFYYMEIDQSGVLVAKMLPCTSPDNVVGFYDVVRDIFLTPTSGTLVAGTTATDDTEIYTDGTTETVTDSNGLTATAQMLLSVGDYKDTQEVLSGSVTRNIGIKVLTGDNAKDGLWGTSAGASNLYSLTITNSSTDNTFSPISTHFVGVLGSVGYSAIQDGQFKHGSNTNTYFFKDTSSEDVTAFKAFLKDQYNAGTPVIIVYPKNTATTESVTGQFLSKSPVTQTAGSISNLGITAVSSSHTTPTPTNPLQINCNNGVLKISPNLVEFNETRISNTTWPTANKTKGFEVNADVYNKSVGDNMLTNANCFGVFVPCKQGESVSLNFFDYAPYGGRAFYCEITADGKCNTAPALYYDTVTSIFITSTLTLTQADSIGFIIEFEISAQQVRTYDATNYMVVRGTTQPTAYMPYGQIYVDGTTEAVEVTGKNLFDKNNRERILGYFPNTGYSWTYNSSDYSNRIPCLPNTTYTARYNGNSSQVVLSFASTSSDRVPTADSQSVSVTNSIRQNSPTIDTPITITTGASDKWLIVAYNVADPQNTDMADNLQIELGSTATTYEPYYDGGTATAEMLLKVGDYQDIQSVLDGGVTRQLGVKVLNGTEEGWDKTNNSFSNNTLFADKKIGKSTLFCSHFQYDSGSTSNIPDMCVGCASTTKNVYFRYNALSTAEDWTNWLADQYANGTPVIVIYPLATATTETVTAQPLTIQAGTNIAEITQASIDNLELEVSYKGKEGD